MTPPARSRRKPVSNLTRVRGKGAFQLWALESRKIGWYPMPIPEREKDPPPDDCTGYIQIPDKEWDAQVRRWLNDPSTALCELANRMPKDVAAIDIDAHKGKGQDNIDKVIELLGGDLCITWCSSARADGVSGHYYFKIPKGMKFPGNLGPAIEMIQNHHRYVIAPGSIHKDLGTHYLAYSPGNRPNGRGEARVIPIDELPDMPQALIDYFASRKYIDDLPMKEFQSVSAAKKHVDSWIAARAGDMCSAMRKAVDAAKNKLSGSGDNVAAYEIMRSATWQLPKLSLEGHSGLSCAISELREVYVDEVKRPNRKGKIRGAGDPENEWGRARDGTVRKILWQQDEGSEDFKQMADCACMAIPDLGDDEDAPGYLAIHKDPDEYGPHDDGLSEHIADQYNGDLFYVQDGKNSRWYIWDGSKWNVRVKPFLTPSVSVGRRIDEYASILYRMASETEDMEKSGSAERKAKLYAGLATRARNTAGAKNVMAMAEQISRLIVSPETFDSSPGLLGTPEGVLELRPDGSVALRPARRTDMITMSTAVPYVEGARHHEWDLYLKIFVTNMEELHELQKFFGYCLFGLNSEKLLAILKGSGDTGKSTLQESCRACLGHYSKPMQTSVLRSRDDSGARPDLLELWRVRLGVASEFGEGTVLHAEAIKRATGGSDSSTARGLYSGEYVGGQQSFTPCYSTNDIPVIKSADKALASRLLIFTFTTVMEKDDPRARSKADLAALFNDEDYLTAVFAWMVEGWKLYCEEGFGDLPDSMVKAAEGFMAGTSHFYDWFYDNVEVTLNPRHGIPSADLESRYDMYCNINSIRPADRLRPSVLRSKFTELGGIPGRVVDPGSLKKESRVRGRTGFRWAKSAD